MRDEDGYLCMAWKAEYEYQEESGMPHRDLIYANARYDPNDPESFALCAQYPQIHG